MLASSEGAGRLEDSSTVSRHEPGGVHNPFVGASVATRYGRSRPGLHGDAIDLVRAGLPRPTRAVDLGCGTGLSTAPLVPWARFVVGIDASLDMLVQTDRTAASFVAAAIEQLPFRHHAFDVATLASAIHWLRPTALSEIRRVLVPHALLVVYDVWFPGEIVDKPEFAGWLSNECGPRYPPAPKRRENLVALEGSGFELIGSEELSRVVRMNARHVVDYLMTHSERISAVSEGRESEDDQRSFLMNGVASVFGRSTELDVVFGIWMKMYRAI
jgi:ubiquinone/menaquinone biosynthesis C-methylase UbiE